MRNEYEAFRICSMAPIGPYRAGLSGILSQSNFMGAGLRTGPFFRADRPGSGTRDHGDRALGHGFLRRACASSPAERSALLEHGVIFFRDQAIGCAEHLAPGRVFGGPAIES
jgi:hypothetical protein